MTGYTARKLISSILLSLIVSVITLFLLKSPPGGLMILPGNLKIEETKTPPKIKKTEKTPEMRAQFAADRWQFEYDMLKDPATGEIPENIRQIELSQALRAPILDHSQRGAGFTVTGRGPNNLGGRTRAMAFDVRYSTNQTILAGGVSSGVFRTTNGGASWTKVSPNDEIHNVTAIAQDPRSGFEDTWYYATGETSGNSASLGSFYYGTGIYKSIDGGANWTFLGNSNTGSLETFDSRADFISKLAVDPTSGDVYAAALGTILRSQDGGSTWSQVLGNTSGSWSTTHMTDVVVTSAGRVFAAFSGVVPNNYDGVWTSASGDLSSWTHLAGTGSGTTPGSWHSYNGYGRVVIAIAPSNEDLLYVLYDNDFSSSCSGTAGVEADLFLWDQSGSSWTDLTANLPDESGCLEGNDPFAIQGGYDMVVAVKPNDASTVFVGGTNIYRSTDGFTSTGNTTRIGGFASAASYTLYTNHHPDIHVIAFAPTSNDTLYTGSDGGIHKADISVTTPSWTSLNNDYVTYQYYHVAIHPSTGSEVVTGGAQDNGTAYSASGTSHSSILGGDGGAVGISSSGTRFASVQNGTMAREGVNITPSSAVSSIFVTYYLLDPDNTEILYYAGGQELYRTTAASTVNTSGWTEITGVEATLSGNIRSMAVTRGSGYSATDASRLLYIGTEDGKVYRLDDPAYTSVGTNPTDITPGTAGSGIVSGIAVNPNDDNEILVTYSNYGINSIYHTTDANSGTPVWTNIEGNLSSASFRSASIMEEGGTTYYIAGTSVGLYCTQTLNGGSTVWSSIGSSSVGYAVVSSLALRADDNYLLAGTHGNGMFMVEPPRGPEISFNLASSSTTESTTSTVGCRGYTDVTVEMKIASPPTGDATVTVTVSGTAQDTSDFEVQTANNVLTFADGLSTSQNFSIRIYDDTDGESDETIVLDFTVSGTTDATKASYNSTHTLTISDNDTDPGGSVEFLNEDFEGVVSGWGLGGFAPNYTGTNQWTVSTSGGMTGSGSAYNSTNGASLTYDNTTSDDVLLRSPLVTTTGYTGINLSFDFKADGESGADYGSLLYSYNGSSYFSIEGTSTGPYVGVSTATTREITLPSALDDTTFYLGWRWQNNNNSTGNDPPFTIDNILVDNGGADVSSTLSSTASEYFGPYGTAHFYDGSGNLLVSLENNSDYDYGCTSVTIDRAGSTSAQAWSTNTEEYLASKSFSISPTNNSPGAGDSYTITMYYTSAEISGWAANTDVAHTAADFKIVKTPGAISDLSPANQDAVVNASTTYTSFGDGYAFSATFDTGFSGFGGGDITAPLPVNYLNFAANQIDNQVLLEWITDWELNNDYFEVQRSSDRTLFTPIGEVKGVGNSQVRQKYSFIDEYPQTTVNYYRLKQIDIDGAYEYSPIVEVSIEEKKPILLGPNPFSDHLLLEAWLVEPGTCEFHLFNTAGEKVFSFRKEYKGRLSEKLLLPQLSRGVYIYQIDNNGEILTGKLTRL